MDTNSDEKAAEFGVAYNELKASKAEEMALVGIKQLVMSSTEDGISDKELIRIIKRFYPSLKITPTKLDRIRKSWIKADADGEDGADEERVEDDGSGA